MIKLENMNNKFIWVIAILAIIGTIFVLMKLASMAPKSDNNTNNYKIAPAILDSDNVKGNKNAKITIIEYSEDILFVYRHFPLKQIHKNAESAARASEAAKEQGKFWEMHDMIFVNQSVWAEDKNAKDIFIKYAKNLELDANKFKADIDSQKIKDKVNSDYQGGFQARVNSTPSFFLNGNKIQNPRSVEEFRNIINQELEKVIIQ